MAGNSQRRGAVRKTGTKKGQSSGTGGKGRRSLAGKGPTPKAEDRPGHPAAKRNAGVRHRSEQDARTAGQQPDGDIIIGRNAVGEALSAGVPATEVHLLDSIAVDERVRTIIAVAGKRGLPVLSHSKRELDGLAGTSHHQGVVLVGPAFGYVDLQELLDRAPVTAPIVVLDHITDPHNVGAIARSAAAFGAAGLIVPERRAAPISAAAWKASAGTLARLPVARIGNLVQTLQRLQERGYFCLGLDGAGTTDLDDIPTHLAADHVVLVIGSEDTGLARLTAQTCDLLIRIPMSGEAESLNASVAAGVALHQLQLARARGDG